MCSLEEARRQAGDAPHVLLTDAFVPAHVVNAMADYAIIHGGQGTVQTAVFSGTPVVGVGMQAEQGVNLDHVVHRGAGIRIARRHWRTANVERALRRLMASHAFRVSAQHLKADFDATNGRQVTGEVIWDLVLNPAQKA
jgi:UDP:flavonoid glycosyltransferase YjiC (YdhE family)